MELRRVLTYALVALGVLFAAATIATIVIAATVPFGPFFGFHHGGGGFLLMLIWMTFFGILVTGGIILLVWWLAAPRRRRVEEAPEDGLAILMRRYARGEIDREEYERIRRDLEQRHS